ncbi:hypothetical protein MED16_gp67 [Pantoea phage vB_PagS_MED16]|nr:hypothetical protein MED16_gp67 [Pantoea phage vB_PagS_MED16]
MRNIFARAIRSDIAGLAGNVTVVHRMIFICHAFIRRNL